MASTSKKFNYSFGGVLDDFTDGSGHIVGGTGNTVEYLTAAEFYAETGQLPNVGTHVLKVTTTQSGGSTFNVEISGSGLPDSGSFDLSGAGNIGFLVYVAGDYGDEISRLRFQIANAGAGGFIHHLRGEVGTTGAHLKRGWHYYMYGTDIDTVADDDFAQVGTNFTLADEVDLARLNIFRAATDTPAVFYLDAYVYDLKHKPILIIQQDDGNETTDTFFNELDNVGLLGCLNLIEARLDSAGVTTAQLNTHYATGHDVQLHSQAFYNTDDATAKTEMEATYNTCVANGWTRGIRHSAWGGGQSNEAGIAALQASIGTKTGRNVGSYGGTIPFSHFYQLDNYALMALPSRDWSGDPTGAVTDHLDFMKRTGTSSIAVWHKIGAGEATTLAQYQTALGLIAAEVALDNIEVMTTDQWYRLFTGETQVPLQTTSMQLE